MVAVALLAALLAGDVPSRERIEADLAVRVSWPDGAPRHRWWRVAPRIELSNRSESTAHRIVKSGDGSNAGWREPFLYATVERQDESGAWTAIPPPGSHRCAQYHPNWLPDVVELAPGASIELSWLDLPTTSFLDSRPHRITVHYEYRRQPVRAEEGAGPPPEGLGRMGDRPAFRLASEPSELRFSADGAVPEAIVRLEGIASPARWSDLRASAVLENRSGDAMCRYVAPDASEGDVPWDSGWGISEPELAIDVQELRDDGAWIPITLDGQMRQQREPDWRRRVRTLEAASRTTLSASRALAALPKYREAPTRVRLRARYAYRALPRIPEPGAKLRYPEALGEMADVPPFTITSDWIEVDLLP